MVERLFGTSLCSDIQRIDEHLEKHRLNLSRQRYLEIGEIISQGREGIFNGNIEISSGNFRPYTAVVQGIIITETGNFGILRSLRTDGAFFSFSCNRHGVIPYANGFCPWCDLQLNSESGRN